MEEMAAIVGTKQLMGTERGGEEQGCAKSSEMKSEVEFGKSSTSQQDTWTLAKSKQP